MEKSESPENNNPPESAKEEATSRTFKTVVSHFDKLKDEFYSSPINLDEFCQKAEETRKSWQIESEEERLIVECFLGIPAEVQRAEERKKLDPKTKKSKLSFEAKKAHDETNQQINIVSSEWQINCARMIRVLDNHPGQEDIINTFWQRVRGIFTQQFPSPSHDTTEGKRKFLDLRRGITNLVAITCLVEKLGLNYEFPTPEQDAIDKIDLLIICPGNKELRPGIIALQLKSDSKLKPQKPGDLTKGQRLSKRDKRENQKLRRAAFTLGRTRQIKVSPLFLKTPPLKIDFGTGKLKEERPLKEYLDRVASKLLAKK